MDRALEQAKEGVVDVMGIVNDMRQQRMKMIQTLVSTYGTAQNNPSLPKSHSCFMVYKNKLGHMHGYANL